MKKVNIERGILVLDDLERLHVYSPLHTYFLNTMSMFERTYLIDEKLLGVVVDKKFNICDDFILTDGTIYFGYISNNGFWSEAVRVQLIEGFDRRTYNPFKNTYSLGKEIVIPKNDIENLSYEKED